MTPLFFLLISSIWIPAGDGYEQIPVNYEFITSCGSYQAIHQAILGCWTSDTKLDDNGVDFIIDKYIQFDPCCVFDYAYLGGNVWTHEILHAWGYGHSEMEHQFVVEKEISLIPENRTGFSTGKIK
jgi:hypothetical protein